MKPISKLFICICLLVSLVMTGCSSNDKPNTNQNIPSNDIVTDLGTHNNNSNVENITPTEAEPSVDDDSILGEPVISDPVEETDPTENMTEEQIEEFIYNRVFKNVQQVILDDIYLLSFDVYDVTDPIAYNELTFLDYVKANMLTENFIENLDEDTKTRYQKHLDDIYDGISLDSMCNGKIKKYVHYRLLVPQRWGITEGINAGVSSWDGSNTTKFAVNDVYSIPDKDKYYWSTDKMFAGPMHFPNYVDYSTNLPLTYNGIPYLVYDGFFVYSDGDITLDQVEIEIASNINGYYYLTEKQDLSYKLSKYDRIYKSLSDLKVADISLISDYNEDIKELGGSYSHPRVTITKINDVPVYTSLSYYDYSEGSTVSYTDYNYKYKLTVVPLQDDIMLTDIIDTLKIKYNNDYSEVTLDDTVMDETKAIFYFTYTCGIRDEYDYTIDDVIDDVNTSIDKSKYYLILQDKSKIRLKFKNKFSEDTPDLEEEESESTDPESIVFEAKDVTISLAEIDNTYEIFNKCVSNVIYTNNNSEDYAVPSSMPGVDIPAEIGTYEVVWTTASGLTRTQIVTITE